MGGMTRQLHLNLFIHSRGHHEASWRHPASSPLALTDIRYYQDLACRAEAALFDSIFLADQLALGEDVAQAARTWLEPITVLAAVAVATKRVGMIATASTTYTEPFNLARQFASLDHISNGRVAWNIVTSWLATAAGNFGGGAQVSHADRYARGEEFMAVVKALVAAEGRVPGEVLILPGLSPMIASTEAEAQRLAREVNELSDPEVGRKRLSGRFGGHDFSHLPLDRPLTPADFPDPETVQAAKSRTEVILGLVKRESPTLRQLLANLAGARGHFTFAGTPEQVADIIQDWFTDGAADGFNIMPPILPAMLDVFSAEVIPILQRRGLFRTAYEGKTLREHYGLSWPKSEFPDAAQQAAE